MKNGLIQCGVAAGVGILVNMPIGVFLFSGFMDRTVFNVTSALHIYGDEEVGDFLVTTTFFISIVVAILVVLVASRLLAMRTRRRSDVR